MTPRSLPALAEPVTASLDVGRHRHDADGSIGLEHGELDLGQVPDLAVLAYGGDDLVFGDALSVEVGCDERPVLDEDDGDSFDEMAHSHAAQSQAAYGGVDRQQGGCGDESSLQAGVGADHRVLDRVGDKEDHDEIERGQLAELAAATEPEPDEHCDVDDDRASDDLDQLHQQPT